MFKVLSLILLVTAATAAPFDEGFETPINGKIWVVLVAGSNYYYNYRHQSDVYHAYQTVKEHGIPDENVIVFHYDDIANDPENPTPGIIINKPNGPDVYHGVPKDYTGADVTPQNFLAAIQGDKTLKMKGKKVVESGPNDHIFIYFADHGAPGLIAFPNDYLYATDLNNVLKKLYNGKRYSKLVFYVEACESGSMFNTLLPKNINIYATTAANPTESSYACYFDNDRQTYLGDVYSVKWIENSDKKSLGSETLFNQFVIVKNETTTSHVQQYGDLTMGSLPLTQFQGAKSGFAFETFDTPIVDAVDSGNVPIHVALRKIENAKNSEERTKFINELRFLTDARDFVDTHVTEIAKSAMNIIDKTFTDEILETRQEITNHECYERFVNAFHKECFNLNRHSYALRKLYVFVNICEKYDHVLNHQNAIENAVKIMVNTCHYQHTMNKFDFIF